MKIVIDMQGAQGDGSRHRGIGRYTLSLAKALIRNKGEHEIFLALNGYFPEAITAIRTEVDALLPQDQIRVWYPPTSLANQDVNDSWYRKTAERLREAFLASLKPDIVLISSLFEGFGDDVVTSIGTLAPTIPTAVILYDLIPFIHKDIYLNSPFVKDWYEQKIAHLLRADLLLAISESSRQEAIGCVDFPSDACINISSAVEEYFYKKDIDTLSEQTVRTRYGLSRPFVMYTGGIDYRKNVEGLIKAYAQLPFSVRAEHQLAIVCSMQPSNRSMLIKLAKKVGIQKDELVLTGFVPDDDLFVLYNLCKVFVFPSWHEGFGLPALEAMSCGRAVIGANTSSLPEVIGKQEALFNPRSDEAIADKLLQVLTDEPFRLALEAHGLQQAKQFSWDISAKRAIAAFEVFHGKKQASVWAQHAGLSALIDAIADIKPAPVDEQSWRDLAQAIASSISDNLNGKQLFVDISGLMQPNRIDDKQKEVSLARLSILLNSSYQGFRVEPVYATMTEGYRYARRFTGEFLGESNANLQDDIIEYHAGDVFFGLDIPETILSKYQLFYQQLGCHGVIMHLSDTNEAFQLITSKDV